MKAVFKRELKSYFTGFTGYIFAAFLLLFEGIFLVVINLLNKYAAFEFSIENMMMILLLIVPIITMRAIAEEKRSRTDQLLFSLPIKTSSIVLGKYLALEAVLLLPTLVIALYPVILSAFGNVNMLNAYACLFVFFLLSSALLAVCLFLSSLTESQIVSAVLSFGTLMALYLAPTIASIIPNTAIVSFVGVLVLIAAFGIISYSLTKNKILAAVYFAIPAVLAAVIFLVSRSFYEGLLPAIIKSISIFESFTLFTYGVFDLSTVTGYICVIIFFVFLTVQSLEKKRWN